jgi:hypothetical protein
MEQARSVSISDLTSTELETLRFATIDLAHAAFTEQDGYLVGTELSADGQRHDFGGDYRTTKLAGRITALLENLRCPEKRAFSSFRITDYTSSAGINRHVVGDERAEQPTRLRV